MTKYWPRESLCSRILGCMTLASMGHPVLSLSVGVHAVVSLLLSWSRKEFGDSEPFGLLLMLEKESVLSSLQMEKLIY